MCYVEEFAIINDANEPIFMRDRYMIPLYQRAFAWTESEINQLIEDICDYDAEHYYLGSLIVYKRDKVFEVIDGQQRLTALFLLLQTLGYEWGENMLSYECRSKSNFTLNNLKALWNRDKNEFLQANDDKIEQNLLNGVDSLKGKIKELAKERGIEMQTFYTQVAERLRNVKLFRIEVPKHTDLNRYFEIMNVRGEQLEQHDILKERLMECLNTTEREIFATIWDACRNMDGYVQMNFSFSSKTNVSDRTAIFSKWWSYLCVNSFEEAIYAMKAHTQATETTDNLPSDKAMTPIRIIKGEDAKEPEREDERESGRFKSIVSFPYFLLHVLKVFIYDELDCSYSVAELMDDKKLLQRFYDVRKWGKDSGKIATDREFSTKFIWYLLRCRYLFDKYIIKREYTKENEIGVWSLKELHVSQNKAYYTETDFGRKGEHKNNKKQRMQNNLMLQSCLRVSYTSPRSMHWLTRLLIWLYNDRDREDMTNYEKIAESIAQEPVGKFINHKNYRLGVDTQHIVFNYLDYLLWKQDRSVDFTFEFSNSVEHWYPQNPSDSERWDDKDRFGNLCLVPREINSKFYNLVPTSKKISYKSQIAKGSLKLRLMSQLTKDDAEWRTTVCEKHEEDMLKLLKDALNSL